MNIEAAMRGPREDGWRKDHPVRRDHEDIELDRREFGDGHRVAQARWFRELESVRAGEPGDRRLDDPQASSGWTIGTRQNDRYRVAGLVERIESTRRELRRTRKAHPQRSGRVQPASFCFLRSFAATRARFSGDR